MRLEGATAILLAGGSSRRMGQDKRLLELEGETMLERKLRQLRESFEFVVISADDLGSSFQGLPVVSDPEPGLGPLAGIVSGLTAMGTEWAFVTAVDIPDLDGAVLRAMWEVRFDWQVVIPRESSGNLEPLFAIYHVSCRAPMEAFLAGRGRAVHRVLPSLKVRYLDLPEGIRITNLNDPAAVENWTRTRLSK